jgi:hypothetical protein
VLLFATPKVYHIYSYSGEHYITKTCVVPLWYVPKLSQGLVVTFAGLNQSVLLGEIVGSVALGAIIWTLAQKKVRKDTETSDRFGR